MTTIVAYEKLGTPMRLEQIAKDGGLMYLYDGDEYIGLISIQDIEEMILSKK